MNSLAKIHIEGGNLNGYYNRMGDSLYTPDKNEDWDYYEKRANMHAITILGKYQILHLYQDTRRPVAKISRSFQLPERAG